MKKFCEAVGKDRPLTTIYGGLTGIACFGPKAVDAFVLPIAVPYWEAWEKTLDTTDVLRVRSEIQHCETAMLVSCPEFCWYFPRFPSHLSFLQTALAVYLQGTSIDEQAERATEVGDLEEAFGDRLVKLRNAADDYSMCFI